MRTGYNNLSIEVYKSGTTPIVDAPGDLERAGGIRFATGYPGGRYLDASFYVSRDVLTWWELNGAQRVVLRNASLDIIYEGWIDDILTSLGDVDQGFEIGVSGAWAYLMNRYTRKLWADKRVEQSVWKYDPPPVGPVSNRMGGDQCNIRRVTDAGPALLFVPRDVEWTNGDYAELVYSMPYGETIKKISCSYDLTTETGAEDWILQFYDITNGASLILDSNNTAGTYSGSGSYTPGTPVQSMSIRLVAQKTETPAGDGHTYAELTSLIVYSETSAINLTEVATDVVGALSSYINSYTGKIESNTNDLTPIIFPTPTSYADILTTAAGFGDTSYNPWAVGLLHSDNAPLASRDGKPVLFAQQVPALTAYELSIRLDDENVMPPFSIQKDISQIRNHITVVFTNENLETVTITPDDDANLKDTTSITNWRQRDYVLQLGHSTSTAAIDSGRRYLSAHKDPVYRVSGPIMIHGYVRGAQDNKIPVSEIYAGLRIRIEDYIENSNWDTPTLLITHTEYDDESETISLSFGQPGELIYPRYEFTQVGDAPESMQRTDGTGGGSAAGGAHIWELYDISKAQKLDWEQRGLWKAFKRAAQRRKRTSGRFKGAGWQDWLEENKPK